MIQLSSVADLEILVGEPIEVCDTPSGFRRVIPIIGGAINGTRLAGRVLGGGADYQLLRSDGVTEVHAHYVLECDGARIYVQNTGLRHGPPDAMERLRRGEHVDPALIYFRSAPRFETSDPRYQWLTRHLFVASGTRFPDRVLLTIWQVL